MTSQPAALLASLSAIKHTSVLALIFLSTLITVSVPTIAQQAIEDAGVVISGNTRVLPEQLVDALATGCEQHQNSLHVDYGLRTAANSLLADSGPNLTRIESTFTLIRNGLTVSHQLPEHGITDSWYRLKNKFTRQTRYSDNHRHGIEYDLDSSPQAVVGWQSRFQLIDDSLFKELNIVKTSGSGCLLMHTLAGRSGTASYQIVWLPSWRLPLYISARSRSYYTTWHVASVSKDTRKIQQQAQQRAGYSMTDFADVGDNESDPALVSMMNSGYISHAAIGSHQGHSHGLPLR